jgi:hypothetical protein
LNLRDIVVAICDSGLIYSLRLHHDCTPQGVTALGGFEIAVPAPQKPGLVSDSAPDDVLDPAAFTEHLRALVAAVAAAAEDDDHARLGATLGALLEHGFEVRAMRGLGWVGAPRMAHT